MRTTHSSTRLLGGGVCLSACWDTPPRPGPGHPQVWPGHATGYWPGHPWADPQTSSLGQGLDTPIGQTPQPPPGSATDTLISYKDRSREVLFWDRRTQQLLSMFENDWQRCIEFRVMFRVDNVNFFPIF